MQPIVAAANPLFGFAAALTGVRLLFSAITIAIYPQIG
jgi:hypothetical protein